MTPCISELAAASLGLYLMSRDRVGGWAAFGAGLVLVAALLYATHWRV